MFFLSFRLQDFKETCSHFTEKSSKCQQEGNQRNRSISIRLWMMDFRKLYGRSLRHLQIVTLDSIVLPQCFVLLLLGISLPSERGAQTLNLPVVVSRVHKSSSNCPKLMSPFFVMSLLLGLIFGQTASLCAPSEYTIHVEKRECAYCLAINTTICAGFCMTRDSNGKKLLLKSALSQNVCTYKEMLYRTAVIPGCPHHTLPYYSYPVAVSCKCGKCNTDYSDCVRDRLRTNYCTKPQKLCNL
ncbi:thyrotropin subunit beta isoform X2 [Catharus ustulatus]|uniref:thyrotropin subunit beta isoform X2 n=1 Tax=Catharus ustulatus TaxID=91951 RepID=UPI00140A51C9|nr:thyrotropin subunit beta isoform X2 [Catharus ustulatus]